MSWSPCSCQHLPQQGEAAGVLSRGLPVFLLSHRRKDIILRKETLASAKKEASVKCIGKLELQIPECSGDCVPFLHLKVKRPSEDKVTLS